MRDRRLLQRFSRIAALFLPLALLVPQLGAAHAQQESPPDRILRALLEAFGLPERAPTDDISLVFTWTRERIVGMWVEDGEPMLRIRDDGSLIALERRR